MENPFEKKEEETPVNALPELHLTESEVEVSEPPPVAEPRNKDESELNKEVKRTLTPDEVKEVITPVKSRKQMILEEYGGLESNVPINSAYWNS